ncbi:MAG: winged helix-turn-helix domain-containing protein [Microscillaceae bacterium]|nr:winged helix-turn-helix domain-containing protein [Microscillaceae bacterium]
MYLPCKDYGLVARIAGIHRDTVTDYIKLYNQEGLTGLEKVNYQGKKSALAPYANKIREHFSVHPAASLAQAKAAIQTLTGIERQPSQIRQFLYDLGIRYRKAGQIPSKADPEKQAVFVAHTLNPLIEKAQKEEIHLFFMDAAHCVMGFFLCFLWSLTRYFVPSSAGRKKTQYFGCCPRNY